MSFRQGRHHRGSVHDRASVFVNDRSARASEWAHMRGPVCMIPKEVLSRYDQETPMRLAERWATTDQRRKTLAFLQGAAIDDGSPLSSLFPGGYHDRGSKDKLLGQATDAPDDVYFRTQHQTLDGKPHNFPFLDLESYRQIFRLLNAPKENGGTFNFDENSNTMVRDDDHNNGKKASVDVPLGLLEYHTHPGMCPHKRDCALGPPSQQDMINILDRHFEGNRSHVVFSWEGPYVVTVRGPKTGFDEKRVPGTGREFRGRRETEIYQRGSATIERLSSLQSEFTVSGMDYAKFQSTWLQIANDPGSGFHVEHFPMGVGVYFRFYHEEAPLHDK